MIESSTVSLDAKAEDKHNILLVFAGFRAIHLSRLRFVRACRARVVWCGGGPS